MVAVTASSDDREQLGSTFLQVPTLSCHNGDTLWARGRGGTADTLHMQPTHVPLRCSRSPYVFWFFSMLSPPMGLSLPAQLKLVLNKGESLENVYFGAPWSPPCTCQFL